MPIPWAPAVNIRVTQGIGLLAFLWSACATNPSTRRARADTIELAIPAIVQQAQAQAQAQAQLPAGCQPVEGLEALGTVRRAVARCDVSPDAGPNQLNYGGKAQHKYSVLVQSNDDPIYAHTHEGLVRALAPVEDPLTALAVAAWSHGLWDIPSTREHARGAAESRKWRRVADPLPTPRIVEDDEGWIVYWPVLATFGCNHDLVFDTIEVARDGSVHVREQERIVLARSEASLCVD